VKMKMKTQKYKKYKKYKKSFLLWDLNDIFMRWLFNSLSWSIL
jgi:hypothetical protein